MKLLALLLVALAAGCSGVNTSDIEGRDTVFIPHGRIAFDLPPRSEKPSHPRTGHAIEEGVRAIYG